MPRRRDISWVLMGIRRSFHTDYAILHATQITQSPQERPMSPGLVVIRQHFHLNEGGIELR